MALTRNPAEEGPESPRDDAGSESQSPADSDPDSREVEQALGMGNGHRETRFKYRGFHEKGTLSYLGAQGWIDSRH